MSKAFNTNIDEILNLCESEGNLSGSLSKNKPESNIAAEIQAAKGSSSKIISLLTLRAVQTGGKLSQSDFDKIIQTFGISNDKKRIKDILSICEREGIIQSEDTTPDNTDKPSENDVEEIKPAVEVKSTTVESKPTAPKGVDKTVKGCPPKIVSILTEKAKQTGGKLTWSDLDSILQSLGIEANDTDEIDEILSICEREGIPIIDEETTLEDIAFEDIAFEDIDSDDIETGFSYTRIDSGVRIDSYRGSVEHLTLPSRIDNLPITSIGNEAFFGCTGLTEITLPNSVTSIGNEAFSDCTSLTSITLPNSITSIGDWAFSGCTSLTSITIPDSVTSIGNCAFNGCRSLKSITIPEGVTSIGYWAFSGCKNIKTIYVSDSALSEGKVKRAIDDILRENPFCKIVGTGEIL